MLHGTHGPNVEGILKEDFRPSQAGAFGPGIYLTNSFQMAFKYGSCYANEDGVAKQMSYLIVNKVRQPNEEKPFEQRNKTLDSKESIGNKLSFGKLTSSKPTYSSSSKSVQYESCFQDYLNMEPELNIFQGNFHSKKGLEVSSKDMFDSDNNKILEGTFQVSLDEVIIAVAHHKLVTPTYVIAIEVKKDVCRLVKDILYKKFDVHRFIEETNNMLQCPSVSKDSVDQNISDFIDNCSLEKFNVELEKEITSNQNAQVDFLKSKFGNNVTSFLNQLSFNFSSLFRTNSNDTNKYKTELLQTVDKDYQFLLRSLTDDDCKDNPNIVNIFKITSVDKNEDRRIINNTLYLQGVKSDKVVNILKSGYPLSSELFEKQCKEECFGENVLRTDNCSCIVSNSLDRELPKGISYCNVDDEVKKIAFVFVASSGHVSSLDYARTSANTDSRGCSIVCDSFRGSMSSKESILGMVPAYLVVLNI